MNDYCERIQPNILDTTVAKQLFLFLIILTNTDNTFIFAPVN